MSWSLRSLSLFGVAGGTGVASVIHLFVQNSMEWCHLPEGPLVMVSRVSGLPWRTVLCSICAPLTCSSFKRNPLLGCLVSDIQVHTCPLHTGHSFTLRHVRACLHSGLQNPSAAFRRWPPALVRLSRHFLLLGSSAPLHSLETSRVPDTEDPSTGALAEGPRGRPRAILWSPF